jgi:hypothetical protein
MRAPERPFARLSLVLLGGLGFAWALTAVAADGELRRLTELRTAVLAGETFDSRGIGAIAAELERSADLPACATRVLEMIVPLRLRLVELALVEDDDGRARELTAGLQRDARKLVSCAPYQPFAWLVLFWSRNLEGGLAAEDFDLLRMSFQTGPYEGWISRRRNRVALAAFDALPEDLKQRTAEEFRDLAQTSYLADAAASFVEIAPQPARDRILARLADLPAETLVDFAERVRALSDGKIELPAFEKLESPE